MTRQKQWNLIDNFRRKIYIKYELKKQILTSLSTNGSVIFTYRYYSLYVKSKITRFAMVSKHRNRCLVTGRVHGIFKKFHYSRFVLRNEAHNGNLPGCRRASW